MEKMKPWELFPNYQEELEFEKLSAEWLELKVHLTNVNWNVFITFEEVLSYKFLQQECYYNKQWWGTLRQGSCYLVEDSDYIPKYYRETQGLIAGSGEESSWVHYRIATVSGCLEVLSNSNVDIQWEEKLE